MPFSPENHPPSSDLERRSILTNYRAYEVSVDKNVLHQEIIDAAEKLGLTVSPDLVINYSFKKSLPFNLDAVTIINPLKPAGAVDYHNKKSLEMYIDVDLISKMVDGSHPILQLFNTPIAPIEFHRIQLERMINYVWNHEKEHLLQLATTNSEEYWEELGKLANLRKSLIGLLVATGVPNIMLFTDTLAENQQKIAEHFVQLGLGASVLLAIYFTYQKSYGNKLEKEAYQINNKTGPFKVEELT